MQLDEWTICACTSCGWPVVGSHDCDRQIAENSNAQAINSFERVVFLNSRAELIAMLAKARR